MTDWNSLFDAGGFVAVDDPVGIDAWSELPLGGLDDELLNPDLDWGGAIAVDDADDGDGDDDSDGADDDDLLMGRRERRSASFRPDHLPADEPGPVEANGNGDEPVEHNASAVSDVDTPVDDHFGADLGLTNEFGGAEPMDGPNAVDAVDDIDDIEADLMDDPEFDL